MRIRLANYISQFTTDIRHISGPDNIVADTLSRMEVIDVPDEMAQLAEEQEADPSIPELLGNPALRLKWLETNKSTKPLLCETSSPKLRPYVPPNLRQAIFVKLHNLSHPGIRASKRLITQRFFWPSMKVDIASWARACINCQKSKVGRHTITPPGSFAPVGRFEQVHIDLIGPLPTSEGKRSCLTMVDRFTRWPEAEPLEDISADNIAKSFYRVWVSRYGVPARITTDQGRQFESELFRHLTQLLGVKRTRTTAYHPQANGCVERWHRTLKTALTAHLIESTSWTQLLPTVLLGLRAAVRDDSHTSAAEMTLGQPLRLPGELLEPQASRDNIIGFLKDLKDHMKTLRPARHRPSSRPTFVPKDLRSCSHVFLRDDTVRPPLTPPYTGPHLVLERHDKTYVLQLPSGTKSVSADRLKPAYVLEDSTDSAPGTLQQPERTTPNTSCNQPLPTTSPDNDSASEPLPTAQATRRGRNIRPPVRFRD